MIYILIVLTGIYFQWTAVGDDSYIGQATVYEMKMSTVIDSLLDNWENCFTISGLPIPSESGYKESFSIILDLDSDKIYYFALKVADDNFNWSEISNIVSYTATPVNDTLAVIYNFCLLQNWPNPFNEITKINYSLKKYSHVIITIYNILGEKITTLINEVQPYGRYGIVWDGSEQPSGLYFYQLETDDTTVVKKMMLLK